MKKKGSMTAAMSLMLLVLLSVLAGCIQASRNACARVQAVNAIDTGLYSLFSEYDTELLETYHLFFLDAGYGSGEWNPGQVINQLEYYMKPVLNSGLTRCRIQTAALDGARMASDDGGKAVLRQITRYMKENLGNTGLEMLRQRQNQNQSALTEQEQVRSGGIQETELAEITPMEEISEHNNPLEIVRSLRQNGLLGLVLPAGASVSEGGQNTAELLSERERNTGFGEIPEAEESSSLTEKLLLQEYVLDELGTFTEAGEAGSFAYQAEYVLGGKDTDRANLTYVVNRLLLLRETANLAYLYSDPQKRAELEACAAALSCLFLIPEGMTLIQAVLAAGWAYVESLSDVKILLSQGSVPLAKTAESWRTQLRHLSLENTETSTEGLDYEDYLRLLLSFTSKEKILFRTMDMIEQNIRQIPGKESFAFDACLDSASFSFQIRGPEKQTWQADRFYSYDM